MATTPDKKAEKMTPFEISFKGLDDVLKVIQMPLAERALKRKYNSAIDEALILIDSANSDIAAMRALVGTPAAYNMGVLVGYLADKKAAEDTIAFLKADYLDFFGKEHKDAA